MSAVPPNPSLERTLSSNVRLRWENCVGTESIKNEPGVTLGLLLIAVLAGFLVAIVFSGFGTGPIRPGTNTILLGM
jgi:hypothetical protein